MAELLTKPKNPEMEKKSHNYKGDAKPSQQTVVLYKTWVATVYS